ncbi:acyl-[acyl-carrier-protein]--UDP-N-acetylglucosamine O-acyltransferase [candidate division KSB1 bacterium 4484_87]|nr:MAG: acyl-[acyl-carrier-protein]--UDP-N-acetylglucosamine O-acyltransferase [candidate division KSB1 bacterium 4484_87]
MVQIHPTAVVDPQAQLGENVSVGPFSVIESDVVVGEGSQIASHVYIHSGVRMGKKCRVFKGAVVGTDPQDLKYAGEKTTLEIGDNTTIREFCTLNRGTTHRMKTTIGSNCLLMAYVHVAHDCDIGDNVILANAVNMAGHVVIESFAAVGGMSPIHQFVRVGRYSFVGGGLRVSKDVPPYILAAGNPMQYAGVNRVGLTRKGFSKETLAAIRQAYKTIYRSGMNISQALQELRKQENPIDEVQTIIDFIEASERGIIR